MTPKELHEKVAKLADTDAKMSHITASDVSRTISMAFQVMASLPTEEALALFAKLTNLGVKARAKAKASRKAAKARKKK